MKISEEIRKTCGFVAFEDKTNGQIVPVGSCFFLGQDPNRGEAFSRKVYTVTAKHVIDSLRRKGAQELVLRLNPKDPNADLITERIPLDDWFSHPTDKSIDVAIIERGIGPEVDHLVLPMRVCLTKDIIKEHEVGLGDEVFISGLFAHHFGSKRNIPIIRVGNLAAFDEEKIAVENFGDIDGYLVEARSTGGLSGSPVFLNLGSTRLINGQLKTSQDPLHFLMGLIHGHFLVRGKDATSRTDEINAGIAVVVSIASIRSVIDAYRSQSD